MEQELTDIIISHLTENGYPVIRWQPYEDILINSNTSTNHKFKNILIDRNTLIITILVPHSAKHKNGKLITLHLSDPNSLDNMITIINNL